MYPRYQLLSTAGFFDLQTSEGRRASHDSLIELFHELQVHIRIPPAKAVCRDLLIGFKSMPYVMRYNCFPY